MEFTPTTLSFFKMKKSNTNKQAHQKRNNMDKFFKNTLKARCTLTPLSLRSARLTADMRFARCTSLSHIAPVSRNISYQQTLSELHNCISPTKK
jgi:hypothetical protein